MNSLYHPDQIDQSAYRGIHERILRAKDGRLVRVHFVVTEVNGRLKAQVISVEPIFEVQSPQTSQQISEQICLPGNIQKDIQFALHELRPAVFSRPSPYFSLDFFMSQPTRAPSLVSA